MSPYFTEIKPRRDHCIIHYNLLCITGHSVLSKFHFSLVFLPQEDENVTVAREPQQSEWE